MASGGMLDPLVDLLRDDFRLLIPDLRGHGNGACGRHERHDSDRIRLVTAASGL